MRQALDGRAWASLLVADIAPVVRRRRCCRRQLLTLTQQVRRSTKASSGEIALRTEFRRIREPHQDLVNFVKFARGEVP